MERIRKSDKYQVLINPNYRTNPSIELSLGSLLSQEILRDYEVKEFNTISEAMNCAFNLPRIDFDKIISDCVDCYKILIKEISLTLSGYDVLIENYLMTPNELKNIIFDRVINQGRRFNLYNFNDVIAFDLSVNYKFELIKIEKLLMDNKKLRLVRRIETPTFIKLVGLTQNNATYEIRLWTHEVKSLMRWIYINNKNPSDYSFEIKKVLDIEKQKSNIFI